MSTSAGPEIDSQVWLRQRWAATGLPGTIAGTSRAARSGADEVRRHGGVQSQEFEQTLWSLHRRTGATRDALLAEFDAGVYLRTHALRPTWHFVHRDDLELVQAATADRVHPLLVQTAKASRLDVAELARASEVVLAALAEGPMIRRDIADRLSAEGMPASGLGLVGVLMWAELECLIASGPRSDGRQTYALWEAPGPRPEKADAIRELVHRFVASHGPSRVEDVAAWSSLTRTAIRRALTELELPTGTVDGVACWWVDGHVQPAPPDGPEWEPPAVELVSPYDEVISGFSPTGKRVFDRARVNVERPGTPIGVVLAAGQLVGRWRRQTTANRLVVDVLLLRPLTAQERVGLEGQVEQLGRFTGLAPEIREVTRDAPG